MGLSMGFIRFKDEGLGAYYLDPKEATLFRAPYYDLFIYSP